MLVQAAAIGLLAATSGFGPWALAGVGLGAGTAMVYPTLLATVGDVAHPAWRASAVGVYRGAVADLAGMPVAIWVVAALTALSGLIVAVRMYETRPAL